MGTSKMELNEKDWNQLLSSESCLDSGCKGKGNIIAYGEGVKCLECGIIFVPDTRKRFKTRARRLIHRYDNLGKTHSYK